MPRLIDRNKQIPNGLTYLQPQTGWRPPRFASFQTIVNSLVAHRRGNEFLTKQIGWSTDPDQVALEVDVYNALICKQMGWTQYYVEDGGAMPPPKVFPTANLSGRAGQVAVGAKVIVKWINSGAEAVPAAQSESRAQGCLVCPKHMKGDLLSFFTVQAQAAIQFALNQRREWKLSTTVDDQLQVCDACSCPMKLKVHMPLAAILTDLPEDSKAALDPNCWILREQTQ